MSSASPLTDSPPPEIPLADPPLVLALAQVRFPPILSINHPAHIAGFQEAIRENFPEYSLENTLGVGVAPGVNGAVQVASSPPLHRFTGKAWSVSLAQDFLAVYTDSYQNKQEFVEQVGKVTAALQAQLKPSRVHRLGVRFVDRVSEPGELSDIPRLVQRGFLGPELSPDGERRIMSRAVWTAKEGTIVAHWGFLAPREGIAYLDAVPALEVPSWILDLDISTPAPMDGFDSENVSQKTGEFADRIYALFRHVFTPEFIKRRGGKL